jgi:hypothetical protein
MHSGLVLLEVKVNNARAPLHNIYHEFAHKNFTFRSFEAFPANSKTSAVRYSARHGSLTATGASEQTINAKAF